MTSRASAGTCQEAIMFRKLKDRINVVSEDIKNDPRFQNGLASVNKVASDTLAAINKSESSQSLEDQVSSPLLMNVYTHYGT